MLDGLRGEDSERWHQTLKNRILLENYFLPSPLRTCSTPWADLFVKRGVPQYIRSDNSPEMAAIAPREWLVRLEVGTLFIEPGSPWENGYCESFNGRPLDELLNGGILHTMTKARIIIEEWRRHYNVNRRRARGEQAPLS